MEKKTILLNNKGMTRDISISKANNDFAYENFNIRIIPMDKDTLLTVTNERGNKRQNLKEKTIKYNKRITVQIASDTNYYMIVLSEKLPFDIKLSWKREENVESELDGEVLIPKNTTVVTNDMAEVFPRGHLYKMYIEEVNNTTGDNIYYNIKYKFYKNSQEFFQGNKYETSYNIFNFNPSDTLLGYSVINQYLVLFITNEEYQGMMTRPPQTGYTYIRIDESLINYFTISSQGKSAYDVVEQLLTENTYCIENLTITSIPIYYLQPNNRIEIYDSETGIEGEFLISKITLPLTYNGTMSITATKAIDTIY